uniref:Leucine-rich repeat-containing N-terminal plant-type domain-containing protein n=1 Tax=Solanum lycopersicum TaxID=4081 RepID=A0A3Q7EB98_SOLLC
MKINSENSGIQDKMISPRVLERRESVLNISHNHLVECIHKGKQFNLFNSSYKGNDGLHGFPLSKDFGGDDGVPKTTTPVDLDEEEGGDSPMISWQGVLIGYACGLIIGLLKNWNHPILWRANRAKMIMNSYITEKKKVQIEIDKRNAGSNKANRFSHIQKLFHGTRKKIVALAKKFIVMTQQEKLIYLENNNFDGIFNRSWTRFEDLEFSSNSIIGSIPSNVSGIQNLQSLILSSNHLNGTIPSWILSLTSLTNLDLCDNHFNFSNTKSASRSYSIVTLKPAALTFLLHSYNNISGKIASIFNLKPLQLLDLGSNNLEGTIPLCLGEMSGLLILDLSNNSLGGTIFKG